MNSLFEPQLETLKRLESREVRGTVSAMRGLNVYVEDLHLPVGSLVQIETGKRRAQRASEGEAIFGEVVGFDDRASIVMLFNSGVGTGPGATVIGLQSAQMLAVGSSMLGRVVDAQGRPIDGKGELTDLAPRPLNPPPITSMHRQPIKSPLVTGIRSIDGLLTLGKGQRVGVFSGPGVGKSTLLGSIAINTSADINVIALVGERGREVREFVDNVLGPEGLARSVVVVATGDQSPLLRVRAALAAATIAEFFRDHGRNVLLMMDSITRFAQAQRQIGLSVGEQPATRGYTPSVFAMLPTLLERAGAVEGRGSITGLYAVLVEGDDLNEPVSDACRGILDGHIALSRRLAGRGHYPAVDVLESISRVADQVCDEPHQAARRRVSRLLAAYAESEELIQIGAYARGSNPDCDVAIEMKPVLDQFLQQGTGEASPYPQTCRDLIDLATTAARQLDKHQRQQQQQQRAAGSESAAS